MENLYPEQNSLEIRLDNTAPEKNDGPTFKLEIYEGPLDLLLGLIAKNKVNIYDIPISLIFEQYMDYIHQMELFNLEIASEFIVMASQLMVIKSRMLLPKTEDDKEDPRKELVDMLLEYKRAKQTAEVLHNLEFSYSGRFEKRPMELPENDGKREYSLNHDLALLTEAYRRIYERNIELMEARKNTGAIDRLLQTGRYVSVNEKILHVMKKLAKKGKSKFSKLFENAESRNEIVATFLAVLELIKGRRIRVKSLKNDATDCEIILIRDKSKFED
ncbi:MAG: segregation/condensation protein A [Clostridiales bacterium]|nr:segregation/condensation protein A [Clostridiales bacterium]